MRCTALTLLALSVPVAALSACAEPNEDRTPISSNTSFFTTSPQYFAKPEADVTEQTYPAGAPFYTTDVGYFGAPIRLARSGYCPPRGYGHGYVGHHR
jgi:hypothetical protein